MIQQKKNVFKKEKKNRNTEEGFERGKYTKNESNSKKNLFFGWKFVIGHFILYRSSISSHFRTNEFTCFYLFSKICVAISFLPSIFFFATSSRLFSFVHLINQYKKKQIKHFLFLLNASIIYRMYFVFSSFFFLFNITDVCCFCGPNKISRTKCWYTATIVDVLNDFLLQTNHMLF